MPPEQAVAVAAVFGDARHEGLVGILVAGQSSVLIRVLRVKTNTEITVRGVAITERVDGVAGDDRAGYNRGRNGVLPPQALAVVELMAADYPAADRQDLARAGPIVDQRRRPSLAFVAGRLPLDLAIRRTERRDVGAFILIG